MATAAPQRLASVGLGLAVDDSWPASTRGRWRRESSACLRLAAVAAPIAAVALAMPGVPVWFELLAILGWFICLNRIHQDRLRSALALNVAVASTLGTLVGLLSVSAVAAWVSASQTAVHSLQIMAGAIWIASMLTETLAIGTLDRRRVLVIGAANGGSELATALALRPDLPFDCLGILDDEITYRDHTAVLGRVHDLADVLRRLRPDVLVLGGAQEFGGPSDVLLDSGRLDVRVVGLPAFYEHAFGKVPVRHVPATWFMSVLHLHQRAQSGASKRGVDIVASAIGLLLAAPIILVVAIVVRQSGDGPVIFRQRRVGEAGRPFDMLKFRTMVHGAEDAKGAVWAAESDPRITPVGRFLRATRLDELPQLWNVLRGEMSLIGPRPERPEFLELLESVVPFWTRRHLMRPGITGWAQVRQGYAASADSAVDKLSYDLYYLKHRSAALDLAILSRTILMVATGRGAR